MTRKIGSSDPTEARGRVALRRVRIAAACAVVGLLACCTFGGTSSAQLPPPRGESAKSKGIEGAGAHRPESGELPGATDRGKDGSRPVQGFTHPGLLRSPADFERMRSKVARGE